MRIVPIPCLKDNYAYLVIDLTSKRAAVIDPSEAAPVEAAIEAEGVKLEALWLTHHHWDHVGGVAALCDRVGDLTVVGSEHDLHEKRIDRQTRGLGDGARFDFAGHEVQTMAIPGHTLGAIAYVVEGNLFSGDTLFLGGCGRVFEGTMTQMAGSLAKLRALPDETRVWCGHEYTVKNMEFARTVEPESTQVAGALEAARARRAAGEPTVPGRIGDEKRVNPFFRFDVPEVAQGRDPIATFTALREAKDTF